jgi:succinyl-CoA synthetase beta subunit/citryl-CoA synthetase large subunit
MARLLESDAKRLLAEAGLSVPKSAVISEPEEASQFAKSISRPVVLKSLLPIGGRQKMGAILFADDPEKARKAAELLLGSSFGGFPVGGILIEEKVAITAEYYASIMNDSRARRPLVLLSSSGGIDVEETYSKSPRSMVQQSIDPLIGLEGFRARELLLKLGVGGELLPKLSDLLRRLYLTYQNLDATLLEVNPIAITATKEVIVASCVLEVDDDALFRHPELTGKVVRGLDRVWRPLTEREKLVVRADLDDANKGDIRYTDFEDGEIGFVCGGGGGSLVVQDAVWQLGGKSANYSEWGGNPSERKMETLTRVVMSKPGVKGLLVCLNISSNTQIDVAARGIVKVLKELRVDPSKFPVVIRLAGLNDRAAKELIEQSGYEYHGEDITMDEASALIVQRVRELEA